MCKPKKIILTSGKVVWLVYVREGGRGSKAVKRRFDSYKEAQDFLDSFRDEKKEMLSGSVDVGSFHGTTFKRESEYWLEDLKLRAAPSHYRRSKDNIDDFNKNYGSLEPNKITSEFLSSLQKKLKARPGRTSDTTLANASVNRYTEAVCAVLNFSASQRRIPFNPAVGFSKLPSNSPEMLFWEEEDASSFLAWASTKYVDLSQKSKREARQFYIVYLLALNTGMRAGEIWGLKPRDLQFADDGEGDTIFVRRQLNRFTKELGPLKGELKTDKDKSRHVPCPMELRRELEALIKFNRTHADQTIFVSSNGCPIDHDSFADRFDRDLENWEGRNIRFHDLRHTAATLMLSKGIDVKTVSEILGHENLSTTMRYVHLLGKRIKEVSRAFAIRPQTQLRVVGNT